MASLMLRPDAPQVRPIDGKWSQTPCILSLAAGCFHRRNLPCIQLLCQAEADLHHATWKVLGVRCATLLSVNHLKRLVNLVAPYIPSRG